MSDETTPLTNEERAELEQLRAQKAAREQADRARRERAELEQLRAERPDTSSAAQARVAQKADAAEIERVRRARERGRQIMEPDDDLSMPLGQKIVLVAMAVIVAAIVATFVFGPK